MEKIAICNAILIRLLKIRRQPTTGFALLGAHQTQSTSSRQPYVLLETKLHEISEIRSFTSVSVAAAEWENYEFIGQICVGCRMTFFYLTGARRLKWLESELTDRKVSGSKPTSASRLPLSRIEQPGSIPALVHPSGGMAARHRKGATAGRFFSILLSDSTLSRFFYLTGARRLKWLESELTDRKVSGSKPTSASRLPLSRIEQPGSIPALVHPSGGMAARHRKGATAGRFFSILLSDSTLSRWLLICSPSFATGLQMFHPQSRRHVNTEVKKRLQANCQARRTEQRPSDQRPGDIFRITFCKPIVKLGERNNGHLINDQYLLFSGSAKGFTDWLYRKEAESKGRSEES
ncbi:LOW QUALITY PROTEIN: hypothetical protein T265_15261 [Opisthorchis viverrini]|uniref:Uncharacterized protein n=1 Tax=Opisthorchis viverrini TaxID=6198 RepID=A0A074Z0Y6_OPIVI|nr:LOW QUALITY PROTEIN: hypothetical protein T265_15261 [Opisthorchis viverrini]KER20676.1 LOW QUALITY PROTEIN: hypothetical protein T265_15261 [Opisthorchis viverrini]